jgi:hypothetical protein
MNNLKRLLILIPVLALALLVAACGGDDDDDETATNGTTMEETAETLSLTGEETILVLDEGTAEVLTDNGVEVSPVRPADASGDGIGFPITGGEVDSESLAGTIDHSGGLSFSADGTEVELTDFVVDTEAGTLTSTVGGDSLETLSLDLDGLERSDENGVIVAEGIEASLTADAADALNDAFGVELFERGLAIGEVTVRATA